MFFISSKILSVFIDPLFIFFCLFLIIGLGSKISGKGRSFFVLVVILLYCTSTPIIVNPLFKKLEGHRTVNQLKGESFDAVIVLTGMLSSELSFENSEEFATGVDRILKGIDMMRQNQADYLIISGGSGQLMGPSLPESKFLKDFAIRFGVPQEKILIDAESRNTRENALLTKALLETYNLKKIALVTSAFHMYRSLGCFKAIGLSPQPIRVDYQISLPNKKDFRNYFPKIGTMSLFGTLLHELIGITAYGIRGYAVY